MRSDRRGDMGFMEAMIMVMIVSIVLMIYLGAAAALIHIHTDPLEGLDGEALCAEVESGQVVADNSGYMETYVSSVGASGMTVVTTVPGGFASVPLVESSGVTEGERHHRLFTSLIPADNGRMVTAVFEVTVWF
ncbi:MAG: hypothetical protein ACI38Y_00515 [Candidatus Methanomethylophilaceae archaeon]